MTEANHNIIEQRKADVQAVLDTAAGRRFVQRIIDAGRVMSIGGSADAYSTGLNDGRRSLALEVIGFINEATPGRITLSVGNKE
jgi:hypothetical protein